MSTSCSLSSFFSSSSSSLFSTQYATYSARSFSDPFATPKTVNHPITQLGASPSNPIIPNFLPNQYPSSKRRTTNSEEEATNSFFFTQSRDKVLGINTVALSALNEFSFSIAQNLSYSCDDFEAWIEKRCQPYSISSATNNPISSSSVSSFSTNFDFNFSANNSFTSSFLQNQSSSSFSDKLTAEQTNVSASAPLSSFTTPAFSSSSHSMNSDFNFSANNSFTSSSFSVSESSSECLANTKKKIEQACSKRFSRTLNQILQTIGLSKTSENISIDIERKVIQVGTEIFPLSDDQRNHLKNMFESTVYQSLPEKAIEIQALSQKKDQQNLALQSATQSQETEIEDLRDHLYLLSHHHRKKTKTKLQALQSQIQTLEKELSTGKEKLAKAQEKLNQRKISIQEIFKKEMEKLQGFLLKTASEHKKEQEELSVTLNEELVFFTEKYSQLLQQVKVLQNKKKNPPFITKMLSQLRQLDQNLQTLLRKL